MRAICAAAIFMFGAQCVTAAVGLTSQPSTALTGLPARVASGDEVAVRLHVEGLPDGDVRVEVVSLLADRVVGRSIWTVAVQGGSGELEIMVPVPETRARVLLGLVAKLPVDGEIASATAESAILPKWTPGRMQDLADDPQIGTVDPNGLIASALGELPVEELSSFDRTGVSRYRGELIICHLPEYGLAARDIPEALIDHLLQGTSVLWLTTPDTGSRSFLHTGPLTEVVWPFRLCPGRELAMVPEGDLLHWGGGPDALPLPFEALFEEARLIVCSDRLLTELGSEPAAGWLWEALVARALKPTETRGPVKRLSFDGGLDPVWRRVTAEPTPAVLDLSAAEWAHPDDEHAAWLGKVGRLVAEGRSLVIVGGGPARSAAIHHLGSPPPKFVTVTHEADLLLGPNLPLWGIGESDAHEALLARRAGEALLQHYAWRDRKDELLASVPHGEGVVLFCQVNFDEAQIGVEAQVLAHLARQLKREGGPGSLGVELGW